MHEEAHTNECFISCDGHQLYAFKGRIVHLEVEGVSYIEMHREPHTCKVKSMDDNCGEWVECMGVASGCGEQEVGVASGSGWNLWVWLLGVVLRRYIDFLILLIPIYSSCICTFCSSIPTFLFIFKNVFRSCSSTF